MTTVAITGASGMVGRVLTAWLTERGLKARALVRQIDARSAQLQCADLFAVGDIGQGPDWTRFLSGVDVVVHLAAIVHNRDPSIPKERYFAANVDATLRLARQAEAIGARHFVFMSTIKVNGERTGEQPFKRDDEPAPVGPYARSKLEAERALQSIASEAFRVTSIRPSLIHGPGVTANFRNLLQAVWWRLPLPLLSVHNRRSIASVWNVADLVYTAIMRNGPPRQTLLVADLEALSTADLIRRIAAHMGRSPILMPAPVGMLKGITKIAGVQAQVDRLVDSLVVDVDETMRLMQWQPPYSVDAGLALTVADFMKERRR